MKVFVRIENEEGAEVLDTSFVSPELAAQYLDRHAADYEVQYPGAGVWDKNYDPQAVQDV